MIRNIWIVLVLLSTFAFVMGYFEFMNSSIVGFLLLSTFIKGHLVIEYFMGLKEVTLKYRLIPTLWLLFVLTGIAVAYYLPNN